jgi:hypothetical protein
MASVRGALAWTIVGGVCALGIVVACGGGGASSGGSDIPLPDRTDQPDGTADAASCATQCTDDMTLQTCPDGGDPASVACPLGCNAGATRCYFLAPSGVATPGDFTSATGSLDMSAAGTYVLSTDDGSIRGPAGEVRASGTGDIGGITFRIADQLDDARFNRPSPKLGIFGMKDLVLGPQASLRITGARAASLLVAADAFIDGTVSAAGDCDANGPGPGGFAHDDGPSKGAGGVFASCPTASSGTVACAGGAGGGGSGAAGGDGGTILLFSKGGGGGAPYPDLAGGPFALIGGSGGGSAVLGSGLGGAGGGALQIGAGGTLHVNGTIDAAGCGGRLGGGNANGGGGGGAGGMIVLEGATIAIGGKVVANGGGGASGSSSTLGGAAGSEGTTTAGGAPGGVANACAGGQGGARDASAGTGVGCNLLGSNRSAAGGGGAVGRVVLRGTVSGTPQVVSPAPDVGAAAKN